MFKLEGKYAKANVFTDNVEQQVISQIVEVCNQPMFRGANIAIMPDVHAGKGCVVGFTAVLSEEMVIPNLVGVDIGCGVMTSIFKTNRLLDFKNIDNFITKEIPNGFSVRQNKHLLVTKHVLNFIEGVSYKVDKGKTEYHALSLGSLGGGNPYIEIGYLGSTEGRHRYALSVHCGSRNLGLKTCKHYQDLAIKGNIERRRNMAKTHQQATTAEEHRRIQEKILLTPKTPDALAYLEGKGFYDYMEDMLGITQFAELNRHIISSDILNYIGAMGGGFDLRGISSFDTKHNYVERTLEGQFVIRKGAISAKRGERVAIPLNMRDGVILGRGKGNSIWNQSAPHGAGRVMSRSMAKEHLSEADFRKAMEGVSSWSVGKSTLDEAPQAYKPAQEIIRVIGDTVIIEDIVKPVYNFKAH